MSRDFSHVRATFGKMRLNDENCTIKRRSLAQETEFLLYLPYDINKNDIYSFFDGLHFIS